MSALLPSENTCCNPCEEPLTVAVPGPPGPPAEPCTPCVDGQNAFTTAESFEMPGELGNTATPVVVGNSDWMALGEAVFASGGGIVGTMEVVSKADSTHVVLKNLEDTGNGLYPENSPPGSVFPPLTLITPIGRQGATGSTPAGTAPNTATYITQTPDAGLTSEQPLSALATGYMKSTTGTGVVSTQAVPIPVADGGTGGITAAAARTSLSAAPSTATFITQTADAGLSAEQALASLATGYMKVTTATGVVSSQAVPIPIADGGTGGITAAAARAALNLLSGYGILGSKDSVDLNSAGDNAITILSARYRIDKVTLENPSAAVTTATMSVFTGPGGTGTNLCSDQALSGTLTSTAKFMDLANQAVVGTDRRTETPLYARVGTPEGAARTVNVKVFGWKFD